MYPYLKARHLKTRPHGLIPTVSQERSSGILRLLCETKTQNALAMHAMKCRNRVDFEADYLHTPFSRERLRMRTVFVTRTLLSRRSDALHTGVAMVASMRLAGRS